MKKQLLYLAVTVFLFGITGCKEETKLLGPPPTPVHGKVTYRGQPAVGFRVMFYPAKELERARFAPSTVTDENGEYKLRSYRQGDGAPPGEYVVTFTWPKHLHTIEDDGGGAPEVDQLNGRYANPRKSTFRVTVTEGENELPPFELQ